MNFFDTVQSLYISMFWVHRIGLCVNFIIKGLFTCITFTLVNVKAPVVATTNWWWLISALLVVENGGKGKKSIPVD